MTRYSENAPHRTARAGPLYGSPTTRPKSGVLHAESGIHEGQRRDLNLRVRWEDVECFFAGSDATEFAGLSNEACAADRTVRGGRRSPADGYTLLVNTSTQAYSAALLKNLQYDPLNHFIPVAALTSQPYVLVAGKLAGITTVSELIAAAKAKPGQAEVWLHWHGHRLTFGDRDIQSSDAH